MDKQCSHMGKECMDNKQKVAPLMLSIQLEVDMGRNCLVEHMGNSFMVECRISKHLEVGMGRSSMVLVDILN